MYGDSLQHFLVAVVVPEKPVLEKWASDSGVKVDGGNYDELLKDSRVNKHIMSEIIQKSKEAGFFGFEIPQRVFLTSNVFTAENDILTPTFKIKRNDAKRVFLAHIKELYDGAKLQGEE